MQSLAASGVELSNYYGVMHPSQTNYIASLAGELCNIADDGSVYRSGSKAPLDQQTIVDLINASPHGLTWKAYMQSYIPQQQIWSAEMVPDDDYPYMIKHNPFASFQNIVRNQANWDRVVDESQFWRDVLNGQLPNYCWFTPNMWNDGHYTDGTRSEPADRAPALVGQLAVWLKSFFDALGVPGPKSHLPPRTLVVVTFDEADYLKSVTTKADSPLKSFYDGPNQVYTVLLGDVVTPGIWLIKIVKPE